MFNSLFFIKCINTAYCTRFSPAVKKKCYMVWIWVLTFMIYASYHLSRKPISVVKNVLNENCSKLSPPSPTNDSHWCDWEPFDGENSSALLGILDSAYLFTYAFAMFFSGVIAERSRLNVFLSVGMVTSGVMTATFGLGYTFGIHVFWYYLVVQLIGGVVQSTGWPGVVSTMGNWFGKSKRGVIMGVWNSHTSVGNILGTLTANAFIVSGWDLSFVVPGAVIALLGIFVFFFLVPEPQDVGIQNPNLQSEMEESPSVDILPRPSGPEDAPIGFIKALKIPGVVEFSLSLFFSKLVSYTLLYWLPHFIFDSTSSDATKSANISTFFDVGGIVGGILAGILNDVTGMPALVCSVMLICAMPVIFVYQSLSETVSPMANMALLVPVGLLVNGPYALITTAVSTELGTHSSLRSNARALSTVTSIIDGTGSMGAAVGPLIAGVLSNGGAWDRVFYMLIVSDFISFLLLSRLVLKEVRPLLQSCCCLGGSRGSMDLTS